MNLQLSIGLMANPRTWAIFDGRVKADGIDLVPSEVFASELFWRQLKFGDFDLAEMSMSTLMMAVAQGDSRWVGIPVFTTRKLFHTEILVRRSAGIERPADLKGKRVGVPEYSRPRRSGRAARSSTSSASGRATWSGGWSACRATATAARSASSRRRA